MENALDACLENIISKHSVMGVGCANKEGLCLASKGNVSTEMAGIAAALATQAAKMEPESKTQPVITLESDSSHILILGKGDLTMTIHKVPT